MINTVLLLKEPLIYVFRNTINEEYKKIFFNTADWFLITELNRIFEIFYNPSVKLQGEIYTTNSLTLLYIYQIYKHLNELISNYERQIEISPELISIFKYIFK